MEYTTFDIEELKKEKEYANECRNKAMLLLDKLKKPNLESVQAITHLFDEYTKWNCEYDLKLEQDKLQKEIMDGTFKGRILVKEETLPI